MPDQPNASGGVNPNTPGGAAQGTALTEERVAELIAQSIPGAVNSAVTSQLKRMLPKELESVVGGLKESFTTMLGEAVSPIRQQFEAKQKAEQEEREKAEREKNGTAQPSPEFEALKKQMAENQAAYEKRLAAWEAKAKESEARAEQERRRGIEATAFSNLKSALSGVVKPEAVDAVATLLKARDQLVIGEDGGVQLKLRAALQKGMPEEDHVLPISEALPHWTKTKEAAFFMPPPTQGGAGNDGKGRPPAGSNGANGALPAKQEGDVAAALEQRFGKSFDQLL